jgi:peroxiredoxin
MSEITASVASAIWTKMRSEESGETLFEISEAQPVLLVFLRQFGCSFCREAISDISRIRKNLQTKGVRVVMVHMAPDPATAVKFFKKYKLHPVDHICDPEKRFYKAFGLAKATTSQLLGFMNWVRGFQAGVLEGHGFAYYDEEIGDGFQMPGVFVLYKGEIKHSYIHQFPYDRPNYQELVNSCEL